MQLPVNFSGILSAVSFSTEQSAVAEVVNVGSLSFKSWTCATIV